ncbi:MAG: universal stress protein [Gammaproteobacteria bacterium]|jgi:universal stress protein E|nr:hypothetical protein [Gammaproteobacteria bacterium]MDP6097220.1 universal stress protein [Gammaproteobacteria bacterium]MDP7455892.1 universal stress protein [Gammaproteobacteria bacterium]|tara:strand:+ start:3151 stop:4059 length:909 start_codon:yes stop_codon:yes gene_type:complete
MLELDRILAIVEPGLDDQPALDKAVQLAKYADSELELLIADYNAYLEDGHHFDPIQAQALRRQHGDQQLEHLQTLAQPLRDEGLEVSVTCAWGNPPYEQILKRVGETSPSLVVKSTRYHPLLARLVLSNEDWELVRYCSAPLLLAKGQKWPANPTFIASVDPSHSHDKPAALDSKLISSAVSLGAISGGVVHLFHSAWVPPLSGVYPLAVDEPREDRVLGELADEQSICRTRCHWSDEDIAHALPEMVDELGASAVIMGAVSRSRIDRLLIGNTAEKMLDKLESDVLVIHPDHAPALQKLVV